MQSEGKKNNEATHWMEGHICKQKDIYIYIYIYILYCKTDSKCPKYTKIHTTQYQKWNNLKMGRGSEK